MNKCIYTNKDDTDATVISDGHVFSAVWPFFNSNLSNFETITNN